MVLVVVVMLNEPVFLTATLPGWVPACFPAGTVAFTCHRVYFSFGKPLLNTLVSLLVSKGGRILPAPFGISVVRDPVAR